MGQFCLATKKKKQTFLNVWPGSFSFLCSNVSQSVMLHMLLNWNCPIPGALCDSYTETGCTCFIDLFTFLQQDVDCPLDQLPAFSFRVVVIVEHLSEFQHKSDLHPPGVCTLRTNNRQLLTQNRIIILLKKRESTFVYLFFVRLSARSKHTVLEMSVTFVPFMTWQRVQFLTDTSNM